MTRKIIIRVVFACSFLLMTGCKDEKLALPQPSSNMLDPNGAFTLVVSNQSFAISPVDVQVEIDGELVISDYFDVGSQHTLVPFKLSLAKGVHTIKIKSVKGETEFTQEFELTDQDLGVITFWYYPKSHYEPTPRAFQFEIRKGPLVIM